MERRTIFGHQLLPLALVAPQFLLTLIFFFGRRVRRSGPV